MITIGMHGKQWYEENIGERSVEEVQFTKISLAQAAFRNIGEYRVPFEKL